MKTRSHISYLLVMFNFGPSIMAGGANAGRGDVA